MSHSACPALPIPNRPILPLWKHIHRPHKSPEMSPAASDPASCVVSIFIPPRRRTLLIGSTVKTRGPKMRDTSYLRAARRERRVSMSKSISSALGRLRLKYLCRCSCRCCCQCSCYRRSRLAVLFFVDFALRWRAVVRVSCGRGVFLTGERVAPISHTGILFRWTVGRLRLV